MNTAPFLNPPVPREAVRRELGVNEGDVVFGTVARLFHLKGHDDLLELAPALCARFPSLRFLWVGDGLLRPAFERRIGEMGLGSRFILTGLVPPERVPQLVNAMDVLVHPSRREGLARALPQGALAGNPVIAYDIDGNREELAEQERKELKVIESFLPQQLSEDETRAAIQDIKSTLGAESIKDMGKVMAELKARHAAVLDMQTASRLVKEALS